MIDWIHVPDTEQGRGYAAHLLTLMIAHFVFLTGHGIMLATPVPDHVGTDPFTRRAAGQRLEHLLTTAGFHRPSLGRTWWAEYPQRRA